MIIVKIELHSVVSLKKSDLGTLVIDNIGGTASKGQYRGRMYRKAKSNLSIKTRMFNGAVPFREAYVIDHDRLAKPVQTLVLKMLKELGYDN